MAKKLAITLFALVMLGMISFIVYKSVTPHTTAKLPVEPTQKITSVESQPVKDFAPKLSMDQKSTIEIRLSDSSTIKYLVPKGQVDTYIKNLPQGATVISASK